MGPSRLKLSKPVIAAIEGPAVAGGMELALWADCRIMAEDSYMGVYNRRWGVPLTDGGTVRLPRLVGEGRALELIMTGRKVGADECLRIGLCEKVVPKGQARQAAEDMACTIAGFPQLSLRADRRSIYRQHGLPERAALEKEWYNCTGVFKAEGAAGVASSRRRRTARRFWRRRAGHRPRIAPELEAKILAALKAPGRTEGVRKIAKRFGVDPGTVQRISRPFDGVSEAA